MLQHLLSSICHDDDFYYNYYYLKYYDYYYYYWNFIIDINDYWLSLATNFCKFEKTQLKLIQWIWSLKLQDVSELALNRIKDFPTLQLRMSHIDKRPNNWIITLLLVKSSPAFLYKDEDNLSFFNLSSHVTWSN